MRLPMPCLRGRNDAPCARSARTWTGDADGAGPDEAAAFAGAVA